MKNTEENEMKSVELGTDLTSFPLDRISKLPDDILVDILSTLELRESAKTSVLSRRWLNLWTLVPRLCFDAKKDERYKKKRMQDMAGFVNWVNHVLSLHNNFNLREFRISFGFVLYNRYRNEIDKWLEYAFGRGVESLELNFSRHGPMETLKESSYIVTNRLLERIALRFGFVRVRALCFSVVDISGEAIEFLLSKCPLLEDLRVNGSLELVNLVVSGPSLMLKHLQITGCYRCESITISDTNIVSLKVSTRDRGHLFLNNLPMLTDVLIFDKFSNTSVLFSQFSCCLSQLTVLTLETLYPENIMEIDELPELHNLRRLVLSIPNFKKGSMIGLTSLIDSCPRLEEFALVLHDMYISMGNIKQKKVMKQSLKGLRVFELHGYRGRYKNETALIWFFIKNAVDLEKIIIDPREVTAFWYVYEPVETVQEEEYRRHAIEKFKGVVPKHVELVVL